MYTGATKLVGGAIQPALQLASVLLTPVKPGPTPVTLPATPPPRGPPPTTPASLDAAISELAAAAPAGAATPLRARARLFRDTMRTTRAVRCVLVVVRVKGLEEA
jgi:hypothetical protein